MEIKGLGGVEVMGLGGVESGDNRIRRGGGWR